MTNTSYYMCEAIPDRVFIRKNIMMASLFSTSNDMLENKILMCATYFRTFVKPTLKRCFSFMKVKSFFY